MSTSDHSIVGWDSALAPHIGAIVGASSPDAAEVLSAVSRAGSDVWLVGGAVRDALLGGTPVDLDFVVVGDAWLVATALEARHGWAVHRDARFRTARFRRGSTSVDLVTARRETYAHPGALPVITPGGLDDDLLRRDFTINAIAWSLAPEHPMRAPAGAIDDLATRRLEVFHRSSFEDDPSRLLRLARYVVQLDGSPGPLAAASLEAALPGLAALSPARIRGEIGPMLSGGDTAASLAWADRYGMLAALGIGRVAAGFAAPWFRTASAAQRQLLGWALLAASGGRPEVVPAAALRLAQRAAAVAAAWSAPVLAGASDDTLRLAANLGPSERAKEVEVWIVRRGQLNLPAGDAVASRLALAPGPAVGRAIEAATWAVMQGDITGMASFETWLADWRRLHLRNSSHSP